ALNPADGLSQLDGVVAWKVIPGELIEGLLGPVEEVLRVNVRVGSLFRWFRRLGSRRLGGRHVPASREKKNPPGARTSADPAGGNNFLGRLDDSSADRKPDFRPTAQTGTKPMRRKDNAVTDLSPLASPSCAR